MPPLNPLTILRPTTATQARCGAGSPEVRRSLLARYGYGSLCYLSLYDGWEYYHPPEIDGFIPFERHARVALAASEPICAPTDEPALVAAFLDWCRSERLTPAFAGASARFAERVRSGGWKALKVGQEALFDTNSYAPRGNGPKKVRSAANQASRRGVRIEILPAGALPAPVTQLAMRDVLATWLATRRVCALGFTLRAGALDEMRGKIVAIAWLGDRIEGFATTIPIPAREAVCVEDIIRRPDAPSGVSELLVLALIEASRARGVTTVSLGLAPLRRAGEQPFGHRVTGRMLQALGRRSGGFYNFRSLEHFKAKFQPTAWEDTFLVYRPRRLGRTLAALLLAFAPGTVGPLRVAASRFRRIPVAHWRPGSIAGGVGTAVTAAGLAAVGLHYPGLILPLAEPATRLGAVARALGAEAGHHRVVDGVILATAGGLYAHSARGG